MASTPIIGHKTEMAIGGIPFYLENVDTSMSVSQNIDRMFFSQNGILKSEYYNLYRSLFKKHERHMAEGMERLCL